jgi:hypothetical protein
MNRLFVTAAMLCAAATLSFGQFGQGPRYTPSDVTGLVSQVHTDLDQAYGGYHFTGNDRDRLNHAEKELRDFAQKWNTGNFDKGELDDAVSSIQHVFDNNHLGDGPERTALSTDLSQLRKMREAYDRHEIGGAGH